MMKRGPTLLLLALSACWGSPSAALTPACDGQKFHALDFWVGEWDVVATLQQAPAGRDTVRKILNNCVIEESWDGITPQGVRFQGRSLNFVNRESGKWEQVWVDSLGNLIKFQGESSPGSMRYLATQRDADGAAHQMRVTLSQQEGGQVRQVAERSNDGGKTWLAQFDLTYIPKKAK